jgi:hypothetical protein
LNEVQKLREAQRRDQQENKENWERSRRRRAGETGHLSPISADDDGRQDLFSVISQFRFVTVFTNVHDECLDVDHS